MHDHGNSVDHDAPDTHRNLHVGDQPLDAANQSLADALRASFRILKGIMVVLVVLYVFSNVRSVGSHEQALVLRLGRLLPDVHDAGLVWAYPFPIDEIVPLPTRKSNNLLIDSQTFNRRDHEIGKPLAMLSRPPHQGLNPVLDGALLTADTGLVHVQWKVTYKFDDVAGFVMRVDGDEIETAEKLIKIMVETAGISVASQLTAEEMIRTRVDHVQSEMKRLVNERLSALASGLVVTMVEMYEPTPPLQVRQSFDATQRAENTKQQKIRGAEQERTRRLSEAAGSAHARLVEMLDEMEATPGAELADSGLPKDLDSFLERDVEGMVGEMIKQAGAYYSRVVYQIENDVEQYRALIPEFERNPELLVSRMWEQTRQEILRSPGVTKFYRPPGLEQFWVRIPLDPQQTRAEETRRLEKQTFDAKKLRPAAYHPVGPEFD